MGKVLDRYKAATGTKPRSLVPARDRMGRQAPQPDLNTGIVPALDFRPHLAGGVEPLAPTDDLPYGGKRGPDGRWLPSTSPNPGGRPASVVALISELTHGGEELIMHALATMRGDMLGGTWDAKAGEPVLVGPSHKDMAEARSFLANRLWGKAPETVKVEATRATGVNRVDVDNLTPDQLVKLYAAVRALKAGPRGAEQSPGSAVIEGHAHAAGRDDPPERAGTVPSAEPGGPSGSDPR